MSRNTSTPFTAFSAAWWDSKQRWFKSTSGVRPCLARDRLLRACLSHSSAISRRCGSRGIDHLSLAQRWSDDQPDRIPVPFDVFRCDYHNIFGRADPTETLVDLSRGLTTVLARLDYEEVQVAVRAHLAPGRRPEQDDLLRRHRVHDPPHDLLHHRLVHRLPRRPGPLRPE